MQLVTRIGVAGLVAALAAGLSAPVAVAAQHAPQQAMEHRAAAHQVTLKASKAEVVAGTKLVLSGKVKPATKGGKVVLQKKVGANKWRAEATLKTSKKGVFRYTDKPNTPGARLYRAVAAKAGKVKAGKSKPVKVTVLTWHDLTETAPRKYDSVATGVTASIKGVTYPSSVVSGHGAASGSADWNLHAGCTTLRVRLGAGDDGDEGAVAHLSLAGDGTSLFNGAYTLTQSESRTFDVSKVFRLAFSWSSTVGTSTEPAAGAQAVLGTPQLLCAF